MLAHLIKAQYEARDPSDELDLVRGEIVSLRPHHNGPNPKFKTMAEGTTTWGIPEWSFKR